jgi:hypothetical protein
MKLHDDHYEALQWASTEQQVVFVHQLADFL